MTEEHLIILACILAMGFTLICVIMPFINQLLDRLNNDSPICMHPNRQR